MVYMYGINIYSVYIWCGCIYIHCIYVYIVHQLELFCQQITEHTIFSDICFKKISIRLFSECLLAFLMASIQCSS